VATLRAALERARIPVFYDTTAYRYFEGFA
jgi:hypothetical protein